MEKEIKILQEQETLTLNLNQKAFMLTYLLIRTSLDIFFIFYLTGYKDPSPWLAVFPVMNLGIIGYDFYLNSIKRTTNQIQIKFTYIFEFCYSILLAIVGWRYFVPEEGSFEIDVSPIIYFFSVFLGLLEIVKYLMFEKKRIKMQNEPLEIGKLK